MKEEGVSKGGRNDYPKSQPPLQTKPELKPCPFCGWHEVKYVPNKDDKGNHEPEIFCQGDTCGIGFSFGFYANGISPEKVFAHVAKEWNNRVWSR